MENNITFKTKNGNHYLYNLTKKDLFYLDSLSSLVVSLLEEEIELIDITPELLSGKTQTCINSSRLESCKKRLSRYIKEENTSFFPDISNFNISAENIKYILSNNPQICFEVTESCNLRCKYCAYGELYHGYDPRSNKNLSVESAKSALDYLYNLCRSEYQGNFSNNITVSFYGGEPLLRFDLIKELVNYTKELETENITFSYSMTTNAVLIDRYIDFLQKHNFFLLISLDGDEGHHSYRTFNNGENSFPIIFRNVIDIQKSYPEYFSKNIRFNSVLHNKSSVEEINDFFKKNFNTLSSISELSYSTVLPEKRTEFMQLYNSKWENLHKSEDLLKTMQKNRPNEIPEFKVAINYFLYLSKLTFHDYNSLAFEIPTFVKPTGTCLPFSRKIFITASGKILFCENISHKYSMGYVDERGMHLDLEKVADNYNRIINSFSEICSQCYKIHTCTQCFFSMNSEEENIQCADFMSKNKFAEYLSNIITYIEDNPEVYKKIMNEIQIS